MLGPAISASTHMQALRRTVSREEGDRVTAELDQVNAKLEGIKDELDVGNTQLVQAHSVSSRLTYRHPHLVTTPSTTAIIRLHGFRPVV